MRITKYWHSCLLIEEGDTKILVDPGSYSFLPGRARPENFQHLTAILITHEHKDHADPEALKKIHARNPVPVYGNRGVQHALSPWDIDVELLEDKTIKIGGVQVKAIPAEHGPLVRSTVQNTAYLLDDALLIPGDSYDRAISKLGVRALMLPIAAPWGKQVEAYEFAKILSPKFLVPIHDGLGIEEFILGQYETWEYICKDLHIDFRPLRTPQEFLEV